MADNEKKMHVSESCHWYDEDGNAMHEVPGAKGKMVKTTLTHAKKLGLFRSVTSIIGIISKPFVENWRIEEYMKCIHANAGLISQDYENWREKIMKLVEPQLSAGATRGSEIHGAICSYFKGEAFDPQFNKLMDNFIKATEPIGIIKGIAISEKGYCHRELGYAGCLDITCSTILADAKSTSDKHFANLQKYPYPEWKMQLSAYNRMLLANGIATDQFYSIVINRDTDEVAVVSYDRYDMDKAWEKFNHLLNFKKLEDEHFPERMVKGADVIPFG